MTPEIRKNIIKHEPQYYARLLLSRNSWSTVGWTALIVSEVTVSLLVAVGLIVVCLQSGLHWFKLGSTVLALTPTIAVAVVLPTLGAIAAKWAETQRLSGRFFSSLPFWFFATVLFWVSVSLYLRGLRSEPAPVDSLGATVFEPAPTLMPEIMWLILAAALIAAYTLWSVWWKTFLWALEKSGDVNIWQIIETVSTPDKTHYLEQHHRFLVLKREVLWGKKLRQKGLASPEWKRHRALTADTKQRAQLRTWLVPLIVTASVGLLVREAILLNQHHGSRSTAPAAVSLNHLEFWYSADGAESRVIESAVTGYNTPQRQIWVRGRNIPNLGEVLVKAGLSNSLPQILLVDAAAAERACALAEKLELNPVTAALWDQEPWRPDLHLVVLLRESDQEIGAEFTRQLLSGIRESAMKIPDKNIGAGK